MLITSLPGSYILIVIVRFILSTLSLGGKTDLTQRGHVTPHSDGIDSQGPNTERTCNSP